MKNYLSSLAILLMLPLSFVSFASTEESEISKPTGTRNMTAENHNPNKPENQTCRVPYVSQQKQFVGVDKERDMPLFQEPKSDQSFFERLRIILGKK
jgi:hypothetical protein